MTTYADDRDFVFNGDNKQVEVKDANGVTVGRYFYDGEGKRVKKVTNAETTIFVYSAGKLIAEYSTQLATQPSTNYTTTDHLGSPRIITDALGQVKSRRDFMPFGEELSFGVGSRSAIPSYGPNNGDDINQKFTGYLKDNETGLDFAEARMYENRHGRFTAVDPLLASGTSANPQTFNRYVYAGNSPLIRSDPDGEDWIVQTTRRKEEVKDRRGKVVGVRDHVTRSPVFVQKASSTEELAPNIWSVNGSGSSGWQALHPTEAVVSEVFKTKEEAQAVFGNWMSEVTDGVSATVPNNSTRLYSWTEPLGPGHSSLQLSDGTYLSFYPDNQGKESGLFTGLSQTANPLTMMTRDWGGQLKNISQDFRLVRSDNYFQRPTAVAVPELDESAVRDWFDAQRSNLPRWRAGYNCSNFCTDALSAGGISNLRPASPMQTPLNLRTQVQRRRLPSDDDIPPLIGPIIW